MSDVLCACGSYKVIRTVQKEGFNKGREFLVCPQSYDRQCANSFQWVSNQSLKRKQSRDSDFDTKKRKVDDISDIITDVITEDQIEIICDEVLSRIEDKLLKKLDYELDVMLDEVKRKIEEKVGLGTTTYDYTSEPYITKDGGTYFNSQ